ncbi:hypothetical protein CCO03_09320 [Comamonas serinivorans]|uniref:Uncharacterized protein n=1 Tax=Comamonas serinivorans TaxID=1082851 RepID=A0A1Y0ENH5_9BURK|nr:hypothetical protein CCO03_09320 [Comamonas serinivorans]
MHAALRVFAGLTALLGAWLLGTLLPVADKLFTGRLAPSDPLPFDAVVPSARHGMHGLLRRLAHRGLGAGCPGRHAAHALTPFSSFFWSLSPC